jgi:hypothetical protein
MLRITESQARHYATQAYIAAFNSRSPAEIELDLLEHKDGRWSDRDRARMAELRRIIRTR